MSEMVKRVARAVGDTPSKYGGTLRALLQSLKRFPELRETPLSDDEVLEWLARAAIEAMREPSEAMVKAMRGRGIAADCRTEQGAKDIYSNIIHAALND